MEMDTDIYDNIPNTDNNDLYEEIEKLQQQNKLLQELINSLEGDIEKLCGKITEMKKIQDNLSRNISELFKTAKSEIERKDNIIADLRNQLESFHQRKSNFSMKRERDKSPSIGKLPPEHVAKKMRHEEDNRVKHSHFKHSRSRSRSSERDRRSYRDRRDRFDRHRYDYDSRRMTMRDEKYTERGYRSKNFDSREHDTKEVTKRDTTEVKSSTETDRRDMEEKKKKDLDKREVIIIIDRAETTKLKTNLENDSTRRIEINRRDSEAKRNFEVAKMDKESVQNNVKVKNNVESVDKEHKEKKNAVVEKARRDSNIENEDKLEKDVEKYEIAMQVKERNKKYNPVNEDLKEVAEEKNNAAKVIKRDQKKIAVKRNVKGIIVKSHVVQTPNRVCRKENTDDGTEISNTSEQKSKTPLINQNEENSSKQDKSGVKVNTTIIVETANKLKGRLEEEAKQDPEKATPLTLQFADFAKVAVDNAEVNKTKIGEVTRKLFDDSEDEGRHETQETAPTSLNTADVAESSKKSVAKGVAGVKIEAVSKKLLGKLEEAKHDMKKSKMDDSREVAHQKNKGEPLKTKNEMFMELFGSIEEEEAENEQKVIPVNLTVTHATAVANEAATDVDKNKTDEVVQKLVDAESQKPVRRNSKLNNSREDNGKSIEEMIKSQVEEASKTSFPEVGEHGNKKSTSAGSTVTNSEEIVIGERKNEDKSKVDFSQKGRSDEELKQVSQKSTPGCIKLDSFNEFDYKSEDEIKQMKIEEISKNLFRTVVKADGKNEGKSKVNVSQKGRSDEELKQVSQKSAPGCIKLDSFNEVDYESEDEMKRMKIEEMSKNLFRTIVKADGKNEDKSSKVNVSQKGRTDEESKQVSQKSTPGCIKLDSFNEVDFESEDEMKQMKIEELSKNLFKTILKADGKKEDKSSKVNVSQKGRIDEESKQVLQKSAPGCMKLGRFNEVDYKSEDEVKQIKIEDMSKNVFRRIVGDDQQKATSAGSTVTNATKVASENKEKDLSGNKREEVVKKSKSEEISVNLEESIKNSIDFTKKRHDMMYGEVSKEISMLIPQCGGKKVLSKSTETKQDNNKAPSKKEKIEDTKKKGNDRHKEKKSSTLKNENNQKSNKEQKCQKINKERKKSESSKSNKPDEKGGKERLGDQKMDKEKKKVSPIQDVKKPHKEKNLEATSKHQKGEEGGKKCDAPVADESSEHNKEKKSEDSAMDDKVEMEKPKETKPTTDTKSKKTKENTKKDTKNKDDDSSGSFKEESDRVLRSATRRSSRLLDESQKKSNNDTANPKNKMSDSKLDLNPLDPSDVTTVNLSHDGEIPVLHIAEDSHLAGNSTLLNLENCPSMVTSSPIKSDSNFSLNLSGLNGSNSFSESRVFNTSSGRKRRRVILTMVD